MKVNCEIAYKAAFLSFALVTPSFSANLRTNTWPGKIEPSSKVGSEDGSGTVLNSSNQEPIPDAVVDIDCRQSQFHGSASVRHIFLDTDAKGMFHFKRNELNDCNLFYVRAKKEGFGPTADVALISVRFDRIPETIHMTPIADANMEKLRYYERMTKGNYSQRKSEYIDVYMAFFRSIKIASANTETQFVREHYCDRLETLWNGLSDPDHEDLKRFAAGPVARETVDHNSVVLPWCKSH